MTEINDDILIRQFFSENRKEIEDNGFSRRVRRRLPEHYRRLSAVWSVCCFTVAAVLFYALGGMHLMINTFCETFAGAIHSGAANIDPKSLILVVGVLLYLGYRKLCSLA